MFYTVPAVFAAYLQTTLLTVEQLALAALLQDASPDAVKPPESRCATRRCAGCGEPIPAENPRQRYCSRACQQHAYRTRQHPTSTPAPRPLPPGSNQHHAAGRSPVDS
jgi:predicted nucleic acid-binding Zn ribbon protein